MRFLQRPPCLSSLHPLPRPNFRFTVSTSFLFSNFRPKKHFHFLKLKPCSNSLKESTKKQKTLQKSSSNAPPRLLNFNSNGANDGDDAPETSDDNTALKGTILAGLLLVGFVGGFATVGFIYKDQVNAFLTQFSTFIEGMSGNAIREAMKKQLAASDDARVGAPLVGTSRVGAGTKRLPPVRPPGEGMSRRRLSESVPESVAPLNGAVPSDPRDPAPSSDSRPFVITLTAAESDSGLTGGPAGLELASRAIFPGDRAFLRSQTPESAAFTAAHAAFQSMNHTIVLAERLRYFAEEAKKNRARGDKYKEDAKRAQNREIEALRELKAKEKDLEELDRLRSKVAELEGETAELKVVHAATSEENAKLINRSGIMLLKGWDSCLKQLVESNPQGFNIVSLSTDLISDSYLDADYDRYVPPPFVGDQLSIEDFPAELERQLDVENNPSTFPESVDATVRDEVAP